MGTVRGPMAAVSGQPRNSDCVALKGLCPLELPRASNLEGESQARPLGLYDSHHWQERHLQHQKPNKQWQNIQRARWCKGAKEKSSLKRDFGILKGCNIVGKSLPFINKEDMEI